MSEGRRMGGRRPGAGRPKGTTGIEQELRGREEEVMDEVIRRMQGGETVADVIADNGWPSSTVRLWCNSPRWREAYHAARLTLGEIQGEWVVDAARKAIDAKDYTAIQGIKVYADALKWSAARLNRAVYGDRMDVTTDGRAIQGVIALPVEQEPQVEPAASGDDTEGTQA